MQVKLKMDFISWRMEKDEYTGLQETVRKNIPEGTVFNVVGYARERRIFKDTFINAGVTLRNNGDEISVSLEEFRTLFEEV